MPMSSQPPLSGTPVHQPPTPGQSGPMSQQNLNQIVSYVLGGSGGCGRSTLLYNVSALELAMGHFAFSVFWGPASLLGGCFNCSFREHWHGTYPAYLALR